MIYKLAFILIVEFLLWYWDWKTPRYIFIVTES